MEIQHNANNLNLKLLSHANHNRYYRSLTISKYVGQTSNSIRQRRPTKNYKFFDEIFSEVRVNLQVILMIRKSGKVRLIPQALGLPFGAHYRENVRAAL